MLHFTCIFVWLPQLSCLGSNLHEVKIRRHWKEEVEMYLHALQIALTLGMRTQIEREKESHGVSATSDKPKVLV
jgi:hypothetical protein